ncbi:MAG: GNAT family N-acetyltransferase [Trueperaceae bacterium]|nr:GNAT family N-acetyltransferase [Trueperaceae bacterium]
MNGQSYTCKNGQTVLIREALPEDAERLVTHVNAISYESDFIGISPGEFDMTVEQEAQFLSACQANPSHIYLLALDGEKVIGALHFATGKRKRVNHSGEFGISVLKEYWGLGIGSSLLDTLINWATNNESVKKINLRVRTDNQRALELYNKKGFQIEGTLKEEIFEAGTYYDLYSMALFV